MYKRQTLNYGHNNPLLKQVLLDYLADDRMVHTLDMFTSARREFLETFNEVILEPRGLDHKVVFPGPGGANAVEAALKLARKVTGRESVINFTNAFHGMTLGALSVTGNSMKRGGAGVPLVHATPMPYDDYFDGDVPDFVYLERLLEDSGSGLNAPAAVIVETVQGEGGINAARAEWLRGLADLCKRHDILLILDDIQMGCGRTGKFFSFEEAGIVPDIICLSKSISGYGLPMALTLVRPELDQWEPGEHNGTFRGQNTSFVTATAALNEFWTNDTFAEGVRARAIDLHDGLTQIANGYDGAVVKGRGFLTGIKFADPSAASKIAAASYGRGLLVETSGPEDEVLKTMPALTIGSDELRSGVDIIAAATAEVLGAPAVHDSAVGVAGHENGTDPRGEEDK